jgi:hypothetical protein
LSEYQIGLFAVIIRRIDFKDLWRMMMRARNYSKALTFAPARIGLAVVGTFVLLVTIMTAVRPDMMLGAVHRIMAVM